MSCILSSSPCSIPLVESVVNELCEGIEAEYPELTDEERSEIFRRRHHSNTDTLTPALLEAYESAGTVWRGTGASQEIAEWEVDVEAEPIKDVRCLILRGEHDFVTEACVERWDCAFSRTEHRVLERCGHHGLNENKERYLSEIERWLAKND